MSIEKNMNTRIQHKHDIEANWLKATNFTPLAGEIIVYDSDENYDHPRIKTGDGKTNINDLPFIADYVLPVGGAELGGVKNGGNVVINPDGTMTASSGNVYLTGAKVGETILVNSVDENGKPTEWKSADMVVQNIEDATKFLEKAVMTGFYFYLSAPLPNGYYYYDANKYGSKLLYMVVINAEGTAVDRQFNLGRPKLFHISSNESEIVITEVNATENAWEYVYDIANKTYESYVIRYCSRKIDELLEGRMLSPESATVGQVVVVKSVDENGKPIEWETRDFPDSGGNVDQAQIEQAVADYMEANPVVGAPGADGKDGTSATHSWNGTVLTITSASGTSSADLKGEKGNKGEKGDSIKGDKGDTGTSVTVKSVSESTADGGSNVVTFSDGKTLTVKNGKQGSDGKTPVRGVDYYTEDDKVELVAMVIEMLGGQPISAIMDEDNNIILSGVADGNYTLKFQYEDGTYSDPISVVVGDIPDTPDEPDVPVPSGNLADPTSADWLTDTRLATDYGYGKANAGSIFTNYIPVQRGDVLRVKGLNLFGIVNSQHAAIGCYTGTDKTADATGKYNSYNRLYVRTSIGSGSSSEGVKADVSVNDDVYTYTILMRDGAQFGSGTVNYIRISAPLADGYTADDVIITINEEIVDDAPTYNNLLPLAVNADGTPYEGGKGYKSGYKMSTTSGNESATTGAYCSGFMPITNVHDVIRVKNVTLSDSANINNFVFYDANKTKIYTNTCNGTAGAFHVSVRVKDGYYEVMPYYYGAATPAFFRFSCGGITDETVVTVNEEIV